MLFKNYTEQQIWIEKNCGRCYRGTGDPMMPSCSILVKAIGSNRKPVEWERNPRATTIDSKIKCHERAEQPPTVPKVKLFEDISMFDDQFEPVGNEVDHA